MMLERELQTYRDRLIDLLGDDGVNEGKFVVVKDEEIQGVFETYENALEAGYDRNALTGFLVKKIERHEAVAYFSRDLG